MQSFIVLASLIFELAEGGGGGGEGGQNESFTFQKTPKSFEVKGNVLNSKHQKENSFNIPEIKHKNCSKLQERMKFGTKMGWKN